MISTGAYQAQQLPPQQLQSQQLPPQQLSSQKLISQQHATERNLQEQGKTLENDISQIRTRPGRRFLPQVRTRQVMDQSVCRLFQVPTYIDRLSDKQTAVLELAFAAGNIGKNVTVSSGDASAAKLYETAAWIAARLTDDVPTGLQMDFSHLLSTVSDATIFRSQRRSVKATISLPVAAHDLSYVESGDVSYLCVDVKTANGESARVDIVHVIHALEQEYGSRVRSKLAAAGQSAVYH